MGAHVHAGADAWDRVGVRMHRFDPRAHARSRAGNLPRMRFGLFIPQGWRQDLTGIEPRDHWQTMSGLATHADEGDAFDSIWVYDHFHAVPEPNGEATHEAWSLINAFAAS